MGILAIADPVSQRLHGNIENVRHFGVPQVEKFLDPAGFFEATPPEVPARTGLAEYLGTLPVLRRLAYQAARPRWESGVTAEMVDASVALIDALVGALVALSRYYPPGHFDREDPRDYFSELVSTRFRWHSYHHSTAGEGYSGTIVGPLAAGDVVRDVEQMIEDTVGSLTWGEDERPYKAWLEEWRQASEEE